MKNSIAILFVLLLFGSAIADTAVSESMVSAAGYVSAANAFSSVAMLGDGLIGPPAALLAAAIDVNGPTISYIYFDGRPIVNGDYVRSSVVITSKITDPGIGLDLNLCSVEVDINGDQFLLRPLSQLIPWDVVLPGDLVE